MIPVLDLQGADFAEQLRRASREIGFVAVVGHGIDQRLFDRVRGALRALFALPDDHKAALRITPTNYRGFIPLGFFTPNRTPSHTESTGAEGDRYEGFKLHWECPPEHPVAAECDLYGPNRWPVAMPDLEPVIAEYWAACDRAAAPMLDAFADGLGIDRAEFRSWHDQPLTNMTLLHYPPQPPVGDAMGIHPHKDTNVITLLHPDPVGGLEVRGRDGGWIEPDAPADALIVNVGEMLELWSGGDYVATPHRVINRSGAERYSFPFFVVPRHDITVEPLVAPQAGFDKAPMPVGALSAEVWRTNWPDQVPSTAGHDLGTLDR
ncbi:MAG: 2OG-Fe(II) oxygenase family protein [Actinomycetota bacterium]